MTKIVRLTENGLQGIIDNTVHRVISESIDYDREIKFAQKELYQISSNLSSIGMRLEGTPYNAQYKRIFQEIAQLNNALISHIRGKK